MGRRGQRRRRVEKEALHTGAAAAKEQEDFEANKALVTRPALPPPIAWYECRDVLENIFFKSLGLADLLLCRRVCKTWHHTLGSIHHIRRRFCCCTYTNLDDDNDADVFWLRPEKVPMHVCPHSASTCASHNPICWKRTLHLGISDSYSQCVLAASAHGLLCLQLDSGEYSRTAALTLVVCNPLTGAHRKLPKLTSIRKLESIGMRCNLLDKSYTILVTGRGKSTDTYFHDNGDPVKEPFYVSHVEIYHSNEGSWEYHSHFISDDGVEKGKIAWWQGQFHWIVIKPRELLHLLAYDMINKGWIEVNVPPLRERSVYSMPDLLVWGDSLLCTFRYEHNGSKYWALQSSSRKHTWTPVHFSNRSIRKATSLHVATHLSIPDNLHVCIFNPYTFTPTQSSVTSSQSYIINRKRQAEETRFSFTPCFSSQI